MTNYRLDFLDTLEIKGVDGKTLYTAFHLYESDAGKDSLMNLYTTETPDVINQLFENCNFGLGGIVIGKNCKFRNSTIELSRDFVESGDVLYFEDVDFEDVTFKDVTPTAYHQHFITSNYIESLSLGSKLREVLISPINNIRDNIKTENSIKEEKDKTSARDLAKLIESRLRNESLSNISNTLIDKPNHTIYGLHGYQRVEVPEETVKSRRVFVIKGWKAKLLSVSKSIALPTMDMDLSELHKSKVNITNAELIDASIVNYCDLDLCEVEPAIYEDIKIIGAGINNSLIGTQQLNKSYEIKNRCETAVVSKSVNKDLDTTKLNHKIFVRNSVILASSIYIADDINFDESNCYANVFESVIINSTVTQSLYELGSGYFNEHELNSRYGLTVNDKNIIEDERKVANNVLISKSYLLDSVVSSSRLTRMSVVKSLVNLSYMAMSESIRWCDKISKFLNDNGYDSLRPYLFATIFMNELSYPVTRDFNNGEYEYRAISKNLYPIIYSDVHRTDMIITKNHLENYYGNSFKDTNKFDYSGIKLSNVSDSFIDGVASILDSRLSRSVVISDLNCFRDETSTHSKLLRSEMVKMDLYMLRGKNVSDIINNKCLVKAMNLIDKKRYKGGNGSFVHIAKSSVNESFIINQLVTNITDESKLNNVLLTAVGKNKNIIKSRLYKVYIVAKEEDSNVDLINNDTELHSLPNINIINNNIEQLYSEVSIPSSWIYTDVIRAVKPSQGVLRCPSKIDIDYSNVLAKNEVLFGTGDTVRSMEKYYRIINQPHSENYTTSSSKHFSIADLFNIETSKTTTELLCNDGLEFEDMFGEFRLLIPELIGLLAEHFAKQSYSGLTYDSEFLYKFLTVFDAGCASVDVNQLHIHKSVTDILNTLLLKSKTSNETSEYRVPSAMEVKS